MEEKIKKWYNYFEKDVGELKMKKPIIGIIGKVQPQYGGDIWHRIDEVDEIR